MLVKAPIATVFVVLVLGFFSPKARKFIKISAAASFINDSYSHTTAVLISRESNKVSFLD